MNNIEEPLRKPQTPYVLFKSSKGKKAILYDGYYYNQFKFGNYLNSLIIFHHFN